ncbi:MAG: hypothetical protein U5K74_09875 [Gemmatimonadaceae bacterium]|nr:hypothetical protein [Gemmatimonadaceae bacterium]
MPDGVHVALADAELLLGRTAEARREAVEVGRMVARSAGAPARSRTRPVLLHAALLQADGQVAPALDSLQRFLTAAGYKPGARPAPWLVSVLLRASACALSTGDPARALALARDARVAATVDSLAATRSAYVGEGFAAEAHALKAQGETSGARESARRALGPLISGYGQGHPAVEAHDRWLAELKP